MAILEKKIRELVDDQFDQFVTMRRDFHRHPELGMEEFRTADKIESYLMDWGIQVDKRINETSVVGVIKGNDPAAKHIALRADIDALPIQELNDHGYQSVHPGKMHACGHDVHTTIQLGAAYVLQQLHAALPGSVKLFFQQAEETVGGAQAMIDEGVLEDPHVAHVLGMHVCPKLPVGTFGVKYGHAYASSDTITLYVHGQNAHGASPQDGVDAIVIASNIVMALQTVVSRNASPLDAAVLSFGMIQGGEAHNVIANQVTLHGTLRTLDEGVRKALKGRLFEVATHVAKAYGGEVSLRIESGYDALMNDETTTDHVKEAALRVLGAQQVNVLKHPSLGVEDFAYFAKVRPSSYNRLGVANEEKGITAPVHDGRFDVDEAAIRYGILIQVFSVFMLMGVVIDDETTTF
ncbi:MAG: amidohydrolase [Defluviitaleaceae bacterium]|nr:amidohydrolase [Defluviitaleaceae bacterium]